MKLHLTFKQSNTEFNKEYADEYHFGKESENNQKENWVKSYKISDNVTEFQVIEKGEYEFRGEFEGKSFNYIIPDMKILKCLIDNELHVVSAVSNKLLKLTKTYQDIKHNTSRIYYYFDQADQYIYPSDLVCIANEDFPEELLTKINGTMI